MIGSDIDLKIIIIMINIAAIESAFTFTRSTLVTSSKSFIKGASPITIAFLS